MSGTSLRNRIDKLEAGRASKDETDARSRRAERSLDRYLHLVDNYEREKQGLEPLPREYTKEDYEDDLEFLKETIPYFRDAKGWQTESAREMLRQWEVDTREEMARYEA